MKHQKRSAFLALAIMALICPLAAETVAVPRLPSLDALIKPAVLQELRSSGKVVKVNTSDSLPTLIPDYSGAAAFRDALAAEKPKLLVEAIYILPRPAPVDATAELKALYGTVLAISSLEGTQYYSASRKQMRTFYAESYRIDGPDTRKRIPDAVSPAGKLPEAETYYAFQRDLTFGPNVYRCAYRTYPEAVSLESVNLTSLTYIGIPVMQPNRLKIRLLIVQCSDALLFYVVNAADVPAIPLVRDKVEESISNRTEALFKWFEARESK
jgi:hypothetical protein